MDIWISIFKTEVAKIRGVTQSLSLMIMDNFSVHCTRETGDGIADAGAKCMMLPPNTTFKSQPLGIEMLHIDVGINKPFKDHLRELFMVFLVENSTGPDFYGALEKVTRATLAKWIWASWEHCRQRIDVSRTLRKCGYME